MTAAAKPPSAEAIRIKKDAVSDECGADGGADASIRVEARGDCQNVRMETMREMSPWNMYIFQ